MRVEHSHCPRGCEHPQPFKATPKPEIAQQIGLESTQEYEFCGRCWAKFGDLTVMVPCGPEICD